LRASHRPGRLCVITDTVIQNRFTHLELAELACAGGADMIQLRDKSLDDEALTAVAIAIRDVCDRYGARFIVNDRVLVAKAIGAGVHLGREDGAIDAARALLGADAIIGGTAHDLEQARSVARDGADYIGFGHVFATASKQKKTPPLGTGALRSACAAVSIPVIAIGGITAANLPEVMASGAYGVAVIGAVCGAVDPRAATHELRVAIDAAGA
jgi:thiamine-phosphate pyrophosphorylase